QRRRPPAGLPGRPLAHAAGLHRHHRCADRARRGHRAGRGGEGTGHCRRRNRDRRPLTRPPPVPDWRRDRHQGTIIITTAAARPDPGRAACPFPARTRSPHDDTRQGRPRIGRTEAASPLHTGSVCVLHVRHHGFPDELHHCRRADRRRARLLVTGPAQLHRGHARHAPRSDQHLARPPVGRRARRLRPRAGRPQRHAAGRGRADADPARRVPRRRHRCHRRADVQLRHSQPAQGLVRPRAAGRQDLPLHRRRPGRPRRRQAGLHRVGTRRLLLDQRRRPPAGLPGRLPAHAAGVHRHHRCADRARRGHRARRGGEGTGHCRRRDRDRRPLTRPRRCRTRVS
ncbi:UNVERIFIED_CONTAM: hypothetical protein NCL1_57493, partial [Trichonephila clavipes]